MEETVHIIERCGYPSELRLERDALPNSGTPDANNSSSHNSKVNVREEAQFCRVSK